MMNKFHWQYNADNFSASKKVGLIEEGDYRVRIEDAMPTVAKNGTEGLAITLSVSGDDRKLKHYIWFNYNQPHLTNQRLGAFFNSFDIDPKEEPWCEPWVDKIGAVRVVHSDYKGRKIAKVAYCIARDKQDELPEWQDAMAHDTTEEPRFPPIASKVETPPFTSWEDFKF